MYNPKQATRLVAFIGALIAAPATAQSAPSYLVINNTDRDLTCSARTPNGVWQDWFMMQKGANWTSTSLSDQLEFQCRPPVAQVSYSLKRGARYNLLPSSPEITLVEIAGLR
jgi:hypothetical protein